MNRILLILSIVNLISLIAIGFLLVVVFKNLSFRRYWIKVDKVGVWFHKGTPRCWSGTCIIKWPWHKGLEG